MALIHTGSIVSDIRGSVATETYARNQGGLYVRERKGPEVNTGDNRVECRTVLTAISQRWSGALSETERADWRAYAHMHPGLDRWGKPHITNGYAMFVRHLWYYYHVTGTPYWMTAPTGPPLSQPICTISADSITNTVAFSVPPANFDPPAEWLTLYAYVGEERNPGVNFYGSPWRKLDWNMFFDGVWWKDPWTHEYPETLHSGQKLWGRILVQNAATTQLSSPYFPQCIVNPYNGDPNHDPDWRAKAIARLEQLIADCPPDKPQRLAALQAALAQLQES